jgi:hypothetical protein
MLRQPTNREGNAGAPFAAPVTSGEGRKPTDRFGASNGDKQTFVQGNCRWQVATDRP